jgi:hypothetical protein
MKLIAGERNLSRSGSSSSFSVSVGEAGAGTESSKGAREILPEVLRKKRYSSRV